MHHVAVRDDTMWLVTVPSVYRAPIRHGDVAAPEKILGGLPAAGRHPNRTIAFGPDGALYVSVGSTCNCCVELHPEAAAIVRFAPDGSGRTLVATGLPVARDGALLVGDDSTGIVWRVAYAP